VSIRTYRLSLTSHHRRPPPPQKSSLGTRDLTEVASRAAGRQTQAFSVTYQASCTCAFSSRLASGSRFKTVLLMKSMALLEACLEKALQATRLVVKSRLGSTHVMSTRFLGFAFT
jgi:hypothetical protein